MSNYKDVKNFLHNELGITREYVDSIIREEVRNRFIKEEYIKQEVRRIITESLDKELGTSWHTIYDMSNIIKDEVNKAIVKEVKNRIVISLKEDEKNDILKQIKE